MSQYQTRSDFSQPRCKIDHMADCKTYNGITPKKWGQIKDAAAAHGIAIQSEQGQAESFGIVLGWKWSGGKEQKLDVEVLTSNFIMSAPDALQYVDGMIKNAVNAVL